MKRFTLFIALSILFIALLACGSSSTANTGTTNAASSGSTPASTKHFKVGEEVTVGSTWKVTVNSVTANPGTDYEKPQKGTFLLVNVSLTNISSQEQNLSSLISFKFKGPDGTAYNETILTGAATSPNGKVAAGDVVKGDLVYDVPVDVKTFTLSFAPDLASSGQTIWDLSL